MLSFSEEIFSQILLAISMKYANKRHNEYWSRVLQKLFVLIFYKFISQIIDKPYYSYFNGRFSDKFK